MDIAYGIDVKSPDDKYITIARDALYAMNVAGNVGTFLVDFIPQLKYVPEWLPGAGFKKQAREWRGYTQEMVSAPYRAVKSALVSAYVSWK
ncbi:hypothetical protein EIP86_008913 [Pleurotus ostreatoroseus]|nr:hypothetical protein EIP86_008913 [Pleurotus ostreatoroseus]